MGCDTGPLWGPVERKEKSHNFGQKAPAQNALICSQNGRNCTYTYMYTYTYTYTYTCARIKRNVIPDPIGVRYHPVGVVREPGSRRMTVRLQKEKRSVTGPYGVRYEHPVGVLICA